MDGAVSRLPGSRCGASSAGIKVNGDIELEIGAGSGVGNYAVRVIRAAAGGEPVGALELDVEELLSRRDVLEATVLASAVPRRSVSVNEQPVREVGRQLFYSERTVKNIVHDVTSRLDLRNRTHAVAYAIRQGLI